MATTPTARPDSLVYDVSDVLVSLPYSLVVLFLAVVAVVGVGALLVALDTEYVPAFVLAFDCYFVAALTWVLLTDPDFVYAGFEHHFLTVPLVPVLVGSCAFWAWLWVNRSQGREAVSA